MTIKEAIAQTTQALKPVSDEPQLEAEVLISHVLDVDRLSLFSCDTTPLSQSQTVAIGALVARRLQHEPLAYLIGKKEFFRRDFLVTNAVLIPRPETEDLVQSVTDWVHTYANNQPITIADIGTGSGSIAITLAHLLPNATIFATDISAPALAVAKKNARLHHVADQVTFFQGSLLDPLHNQNIDIVVANLPYIPTQAVATLAANVKDYEPPLALDGGSDGFDYYRKLFDQLLQQPFRFLAVEIDPSQAAIVRDVLRKQYPTITVTIRKDHQGFERIVLASFLLLSNDNVID